VGRSVVHHPDVERARRPVRVDGVETLRQQRARVPVDDDDGQLHYASLSGAGCMRAIASKPPRNSQGKRLARKPSMPMLYTNGRNQSPCMPAHSVPASPARHAYTYPRAKPLPTRLRNIQPTLVRASTSHAKAASPTSPVCATMSTYWLCELKLM